ncbi:maleylpyruvate isomerase family mycothiol-dependent enzyme [Nonomuraea spiralis]|uniref:maleylpyruvate isomerase family mycothiol-dependent enzyme n=1 Tax=Nonomuraea TaxID=83681 RepID=UPI000F79BE05|nr:maleylpyruvate isomerase family mycothiol-dependent enzyme [Nonomuraea sp. WAC 01424]RSN06773.1 maleylpyruvate isomerase family mycothiol-dependent enzyme [Nonomuraea sp. WAC 01424]
MRELGHERLALGLKEQTAAFARVVAEADPDTVVPTCPEWRVRDLAGHIGQAHRWAAEIVRTGAYAAVPAVPDAEPGEPARWTGWLEEGAATLTGAVRDGGPERPVWTFLGPRPALFWLRRMLNETCVHHADAALATGAGYEVAADLAADGIGEGLALLSDPAAEAFLPRLAGLRGQGERIAIRPSGATGWTITRTPDGVRYERGDSTGDVTASGAVADLLLLFSRRLPSGHPRLTITGDRALLDHWLAATQF